jgi:hypothetical protein
VLKIFKSLSTGNKFGLLVLVFNIVCCIEMQRLNARIRQGAAEAKTYAKIAMAACGGGNVAGGYNPVSVPRY